MIKYDDFEDQDCCSCFIKFRVPNGMTEKRRSDGKTFYCPNGHPMCFNQGETRETLLTRERDRLKQREAQLQDAVTEEKRKREHAMRLLEAASVETAAVKKSLVKLKKRAATGTCPCCNRNFAELQKHIATKHPTFRADDIEHEKIISIVRSKAS